MEKRGIPAVPIGVEKLAMTTGRGMAKIQGYPNLPIVMLSYRIGNMIGERDPEVIRKLAEEATVQVERALLGK